MCQRLSNNRRGTVASRANNANGRNPQVQPYILPARANNTHGTAAPNNANVCNGLLPIPIPPLGSEWSPGTAKNVVITIANTNHILDDAWDIFVNDEWVGQYDGGGETSVSISKDYPPGQELHVKLRYAREQNDNFFQAYVTMNGACFLNWEGYLPGDPGDVIDLGTLTT